MARTHEFSQVVGGIAFVYDRCEHCGALPTNQEILDQVERIKKEYGTPCAVCGDKQKVTEAILLHHKQDGLDRWGGEVTLTERFWIGNVWHTNLALHEKCAKAAFPYSSLGDKLCVQCHNPIKGLATYNHPRAGGGPYCSACCEVNEKFTYT